VGRTGSVGKGTGVSRPNDAAGQTDGPAAQAPEEPQRRAVPPEQVLVVDLDALYRAYEGDVAAADAQYRGRRLRFAFRPWAIATDDSGCYAWDNVFGLDDSDRRGRHRRRYFRAGQPVAPFAFRGGATLTIRGVCAGKTGEVETSYPTFRGGRGVTKASPAVTFTDCVLLR
jgi:hypothetical protein